MSNQVLVDESVFQNLKGKVVVLTGGANGIGKDTLLYLVNAGAHVVFGDFDGAAGEAVVRRFVDQANALTFVQMDVSSYEDNLKLFKTAHEKHGRVDHGIACAGTLEKGKWFDPELTIETVEKPETTKVIDVNLKGVLYFTRIAVVYLKHGRKPGEDKSIVLISSAAGFRDSPGLFLYQSSKHAVMGLLRSTRKIFYERDQIRINVICPAITDSAMTTSIIESFKQSNLDINSTQDVAKYIVWLQATSSVIGKAIYVEGGRGWEFMDGLEASMSVWLGSVPTQGITQHLQHVQQGAGWKIE